MWKYESLLTPLEKQYRISLGEGNTPLIQSKKIGPSLGLKNLFFKLENLNPTGSYKDRFAAAFVSRMKSLQQDLCVATSSGNTGAALSAYSAAAGIKCVLAIVDGAPLPKIRQMQLYGAHTIMIDDFGKDPLVTSDVFQALNEFTAKKGLPLPVSAYVYCKEGMEGVQTIAYEILEEINADHIFCPAGGGGLTLAVAKGSMIYAKANSSASLPKVHCVQPEGNDTIASALRNESQTATAVSKSTTAVSGLQVPSILDGDQVIEACSALGGTGYIVADAEVFECQRMLAQQEGIFSEPAGAVALAGLKSALIKHEINADDFIVCLITGSGFKDMVSVDKYFGLPEIEKKNGKDLINEIENFEKK